MNILEWNKFDLRLWFERRNVRASNGDGAGLSIREYDDSSEFIPLFYFTFSIFLDFAPAAKTVTQNLPQNRCNSIAPTISDVRTERNQANAVAKIFDL